MKEVKQFQTESKELLNLMINSIYTNKEIFLRELISNASDAIDKYKYLALNSNGEIPTEDYEIRIELDDKKRTLTISDNGIGMNKDDLNNHLGTIAKSGSKEFMEKMKKAKEKDDINIIGQFGVGFYSAFMVAEKVEVLTKTYKDEAYLFTSEGEDSYSIEEANKDNHGTSIKIYLKKSKKDEEDYEQFVNSYTIESLVSRYSDYIRYPIKMKVKSSKPKLDEEGKPIEGQYDEVIEDKTLNSMVPLWKKNKNEVKDEELNQFYKDKFMDYEDPLISLFVNVDGMISYNSLLFIPSHAPYNLYSENYEKGLQLYAKGVFIKDKCPELVPDYLKFVKGLVDSDSFNLNISREMLQSSPMMKKIATNIEKKIVDKLKDIKKTDFDKYVKFFETFGEHLKYGIYSTYGEKKELLEETLIFHHLKEDKYISLKEYKDNMKKDQKYIYYASGDNLDKINLLPQIEKYRKQEVDVLLFDKQIDEFALMMMREYDKVEFKSISSADDEEVTKEEKEKVETLQSDNKRLLDNLKEGLTNKVDDVIFSSKLVDSPVCITTKEGLSLEMEKTLNAQPGDREDVKATKVLEINPEHELVKAFMDIQDQDEEIKDLASLLYDEALLLEGYEISDRHDFVSKLNKLMLKGLKK